MCATGITATGTNDKWWWILDTIDDYYENYKDDKRNDNLKRRNDKIDGSVKQAIYHSCSTS